MLTVIRSWSEYLEKNREEIRTFEDLYEKSIDTAYSALKATTGQLEVLKKHNLVDSGGSGFVYFLEGIKNALHSIGQDESGNNNENHESVQMESLMKNLPADFDQHEESSIYRYCCECLITGTISQSQDIREALEKLQLNDAALQFEPESSQALGFGFRCGFLGLLHMDVIQERLEREFNLDMITTAPSVVYHVNLTDGSMVVVDNPAEFPDPVRIENVEEPYVKAQIMVPNEYVGAVMELAQRKRGDFVTMDYLDEFRVNVIYDIPLSEIVYDFFDKLKSSTKGYASLDYEISGYRPSNLVKMDILLNAEKVDALSFIVHRNFSFERGKAIVEKLRKLIPRQQFEVPIQAAIGQKIVARSDIKALRKNVLAKCYGGDVSRKRKLLEKQKQGKKRMKQIGSVEVPQDAFMAVLKMDDDA